MRMSLPSSMFIVDCTLVLAQLSRIFRSLADTRL
jgi:hypothetical protein